MKKILLLIGTTVVVLASAPTFPSDGADALERFHERNKEFFQRQKDEKKISDFNAELARQASEKKALATAQGKVGVSNTNDKTN